MNKLRYKSLVTLMIVFVLFSCKKITDQSNESGISAGNFFKTATDADNAMTACYDGFQQPMTYFFWGEGRADLFAATDRSAATQLQIISGDVNAEHEYARWDQMYRTLNRINGVLKNVPLITDPALATRKERILGEAYYLRALAYFYLVRTFENIPLILEPYESLAQDLFPVQADPADVFAQIESDLKAAEQRITSFTPFASAAENKGRATAGAIKATMADFYLWQKNYPEAIKKAEEVLAGPYTLVSGANYATIFTSKNTSESIFDIQFNNTFLETANNGAGSSNPLIVFLPVGGANYVGGGWPYQPSQKLIDAFTPGDVRINITYRNTGNPPAPYRDPNLNYINKYQGTLANNNLQRHPDNNFIIYRLADVILLYAEALNEDNRTPDAITQLDRIRTRAQIGNTTAVTKDEVRVAIEEERFRELAYEGKRYFDLKRTGRYAAVTGHTNPDWLRWPISNQELTLNRNLEQNSGY